MQQAEARKSGEPESNHEVIIDSFIVCWVMWSVISMISGVVSYIKSAIKSQFNGKEEKPNDKKCEEAGTCGRNAQGGCVRTVKAWAFLPQNIGQNADRFSRRGVQQCSTTCTRACTRQPFISMKGKGASAAISDAQPSTGCMPRLIVNLESPKVDFTSQTDQTL